MMNCKIRQQADVAELYLYGDICEEAYFDNDVTPTRVVDAIRAIEAPAIEVHVDSYGGLVSAGWAIYNALRASGKAVTTYGDGFVASAALFPFLAGDKRVASNLSAYFLHKVMTYADGYADDLRAAAEEADKLTDIGVSVFVERAGMDADKVLELMEAETWLSAAEAVELGIATEVAKADADANPAQSVRGLIIQRLTAAETPAEETPEADTNQQHQADIMGLFANI